MALPDGRVARALRPAREDRLTVAEVIARLEELPPYYPTNLVDVVDVAREGGYRVVEFVR